MIKLVYLMIHQSFLATNMGFICNFTKKDNADFLSRSWYLHLSKMVVLFARKKLGFVWSD